MQFGLTQQLGDKGTVSVGLRNTDIDCFTSPYTMLFTGSSYTSFPTLSFNFSLATAPVAALALHAEYQPIEKLTIKETLYNGRADDRLNRQFRFCPQSDGLINITSIHYSDEEHYTYSLGAGLGNSGIENEESGTLEKPFQYALWLLAEQELCTIGKSGLGLMLQGSIAPKESSYCSHYRIIHYLSVDRNRIERRRSIHVLDNRTNRTCKPEYSAGYVTRHIRHSHSRPIDRRYDI